MTTHEVETGRAEVQPSTLLRLARPALSAPVCFVHVPKTAGGTLKSVLSRAYTPDAIRDAGNFIRNPEKVGKKVARMRNIVDRILIGHVPYSLFRPILPDRTRYITMMREPVDRVLSHYYRHLQGDRQTIHNLQSLTEALEIGLPQMTNLATRLLCNEPFSELSTDSLRDAKANLRSFTFVGLQERFDESVTLLQRALGLEHLVPYGASRHVTQDRPTPSSITEGERRLILERNALDAELYAYAKDLFGERVAMAGAALASDVERLRKMCGAAVIDDEEERRKAALWLDNELPPGTTRPAQDLIEAAIAAGFKEYTIKLEMQALRKNSKAALLLQRTG